MNYLHDCGGINAAGPAWDEFGWECVGMTEIDKFPIAVVKHHYPNLVQYGDTTKLKGKDLTARIDLLIGGTPCQGFSVAGKRGGLDDERSNLAWNFLRLAAESRARWIIWKNVPGASSTNEGKDLLSFFGQVEKLGYGFAWRTLDAANYGCRVPRPRIFMVAYLGDWRPPAAVLFNKECFGRSKTPNKKTSQRRSPAVFTAKGTMAYDDRTNFILDDNGIRLATPNEIGRAMGFPDGYTSIPAKNLFALQNDKGIRSVSLPAVRKDGEAFVVQGVRKLQTARFEKEACYERREAQMESEVSLRDYAEKVGRNVRQSGRSVCDLSIHSKEASAGSQPQDRGNTRHSLPCLQYKAPSRRGYAIFTDSNGISKEVRIVGDGPQYKALGNSIAVPVLRHLGNRIAIVERLISLPA